jgi:hypothetical protein
VILHEVNEQEQPPTIEYLVKRTQPIFTTITSLNDFLIALLGTTQFRHLKTVQNATVFEKNDMGQDPLNALSEIQKDSIFLYPLIHVCT